MFIRRPDYRDITSRLCWPNDLATWSRDINESHSDMKKGTFKYPNKVLLLLLNTKIMPTMSGTDVPRVKCV